MDINKKNKKILTEEGSGEYIPTTMKNDQNAGMDNQWNHVTLFLKINGVKLDLIGLVSPSFCECWLMGGFRRKKYNPTISKKGTHRTRGWR
mmetsp:Transcript_16832/g.21951  ORF Transcript_16832/g.21951 Transcript_16832/m.21951 type:complete len:91 (+) Transcript_16832:687-959(+)